MKDKLRKVSYFYTMIPNRPGQGARIMAALAAKDVDLLAFSCFPSGKVAQLDLVPADSARLKRAAKSLSITLTAKKTGFLFQGDDSVGAMVKILDTLAAAKINVTACDAVTSGKGRFGAIFWVKPKAVAKAAKVLGAK
jgi:hypothetical protein